MYIVTNISISIPGRSGVNIESDISKRKALHIDSDT